jgi:hyperosmotically inducible protein
MNTPKLMASLAALLALAACDSRQDGTTVGQKVDQAVASAKDAAADVKQTAKEGLDSAAQVSQQKGDKVAQKVGDATITAAVNAGLAKDPELSALRINVDTKNGQVALYGSAPNEGAKQRAQQIAMAEKGVTGVDNQLAVEKR